MATTVTQEREADGDLQVLAEPADVTTQPNGKQKNIHDDFAGNRKPIYSIHNQGQEISE